MVLRGESQWEKASRVRKRARAAIRGLTHGIPSCLRYRRGPAALTGQSGRWAVEWEGKYAGSTQLRVAQVPTTSVHPPIPRVTYVPPTRLGCQIQACRP